MVRRYLLAAIASGVAAGEIDVARNALARIDWILRGRARRRLEALLIDASLASGVLDSEPPANARHVLRAAALILEGRSSQVALTDSDAVTIAYGDDGESSQPPRFPLASVGAAVGVLTITATTALATMAVRPHAPYQRPAVAAPTGSYRDGGSFTRDAVLESELTRLASATPSPESPTTLTSGARDAWRDLVDALVTGGRDRDEVRARVLHLGDELAAAGHGYFLDVEFAPNHIPVITPYRVDRVSFVRAGDERIRVLDLRTVVARHRPRPWLGMKPEGVDDAIVLLDQIEDHVRSELEPVMRGRRYILAEDGWAATAVAREATSAATRGIRRELATAVGTSSAGASDAKGRLTKLLIASVRHHEAQHGYENDGHEPAMPDVLAAHTGPLQLGRQANVRAIRSRNELSAYLSQIASDMWLPQVALWSVARHAFHLGHDDTPEAIAAVIIIEGLARQRGIAVPRSALGPGRIDRNALAELIPVLADTPTIELRSAAARLWGELFGAPLVRLVDDVFGV